MRMTTNWLRVRTITASIATAAIMFFFVVALWSQGSKLNDLVDSTRRSLDEHRIADQQDEAADLILLTDIRAFLLDELTRDLAANKDDHELLLQRIRELLDKPRELHIIERDGQTIIITRPAPPGSPGRSENRRKP